MATPPTCNQHRRAARPAAASREDDKPNSGKHDTTMASYGPSLRREDVQSIKISDLNFRLDLSYFMFDIASLSPGSNSSSKSEEVKRTARAERFRLEQITPTNEEARRRQGL